MKLHIVYIPGLGDSYDAVRRLGLLTWRRRGVAVTLVSMRWSDKVETFEDKLARIEDAIQAKAAPVVLVGESAGGAMAITAASHVNNKIAHVMTLCGMNQGAANVSPRLYRKNPAFRTVMERADRVVAALTADEKKKMTILYSSQDFTVRPRNSLIPGVVSVDLKTPGHMIAILSVLYLRSRFVYKLLDR